VATYLLSTADEKILRLFTTYPYLIVEQAMRLLYSRGSIKYVSAKLKNLTEQKYLHRRVKLYNHTHGMIKDRCIPALYTHGNSFQKGYCHERSETAGRML
jgi:hypothetical protein